MSNGDVEADSAERYLIKRVQQSLRRRCDAELRPTGLTMAQYTALRALADHPDASASELSRLCFVTRQSLQDVLAGLRSAGFVRDAKVPPRGRARSLELTPAGAKRLTAAHSRRDGGGNAHARRDFGECAIPTERITRPMRAEPRGGVAAGLLRFVVHLEVEL